MRARIMTKVSIVILLFLCSVCTTRRDISTCVEMSLLFLVYFVCSIRNITVGVDGSLPLPQRELVVVNYPYGKSLQ
jgi:hypothetical protein